MALAITAPVASGSGYDPAQTPQSIQGEALPDFVGTGATASGNVSIRIYADEVAADVTVTVAADGSGNWTTSGKLSYVPNLPGVYNVVITDVTSASVVNTSVEVFESEGV